MEFGAHILWFHSPHEYFKTAEYEQQTRSLSAPTRYHSSVIPTIGSPGSIRGTGLLAVGQLWLKVDQPMRDIQSQSHLVAADIAS